jgi:ribosomal protein S18 acetylase RimI-like enzyme
MLRGTVRKAQLRDAHPIAVVHVTASRATYADLLPTNTLDAFPVERRAKQWHQIIAALGNLDDTGVFVAEDESSTILGFGCCSRQRSAEMAARGFNGEFQSIYVLSSSQGRGLGRKLMVEMARHLISRSLSSGSCWVLRENDRARRFYEALGGQLVGQRVDELEAGTPLVEVAYGWQDLNSLSDE